MCQWILLVKAVDRWYCTLSTCPTTLEIKHTEPEGIGPQKEQKNSQVSRKSSNLPWFYGCFLKYLVKLGVPKPPKKRLTIHLLPFIFLFDRPTISFLPKNIERLDLGSLVLRHMLHMAIKTLEKKACLDVFNSSPQPTTHLGQIFGNRPLAQGGPPR